MCYPFSLIKWNYTKFLIDKEGQPVKRYGPMVQPKVTNNLNFKSYILKVRFCDFIVLCYSRFHLLQFRFRFLEYPERY